MRNQTHPSNRKCEKFCVKLAPTVLLNHQRMKPFTWDRFSGGGRRNTEHLSDALRFLRGLLFKPFIFEQEITEATERANREVRFECGNRTSVHIPALCG